MQSTSTTSDYAAELYIDLLKRSLTRYAVGERYRPLTVRRQGGPSSALLRALQKLLASSNLELVRKAPYDPEARLEGRDWPAEAETMVGLKRLDNVQHCVADVLRRGVPGDLIETGVWRGGVTILMRGVLEAYGDTERVVWVADSFKGLPKPDSDRWPADAQDEHWTQEQLAIPLDEVKSNFQRYGLLDDRVRFLEGWFEETLPRAPIDRLSVLRLDGDMYGSTMEALTALYPKLSSGGYVIIDDYGAIAQCRRAVQDYREAHSITDPIEEIDYTGVFWQRS